MTIFYRPFIAGVLCVIQVVSWGVIFQGNALAEHANQLFPTLESAKRQGIPEDILNYLLAYSVENSLDADHAVHVIQILTHVKEMGLSLAPFQDKIREGISKHVAPGRIEEGLKEILSDYQFARDLLKEKFEAHQKQSETALQSLVEGLELGLSRQELRSFCESSPSVPPEMLAIAVRNLAYLKQIDFDSKLGDKILSTGLTNKSLTAEWSPFYRLASTAKRKGISDGDIAQAAVEALKEKKDLRQVLKRLGFILRNVKQGPLRSLPEDEVEKN